MNARKSRKGGFLNEHFCYQCEQSAAPGGCTVQGVCGKTAPVANLQDELTAALVGLARALDVKGQTKEALTI